MDHMVDDQTLVVVQKADRVFLEILRKKKKKNYTFLLIIPTGSWLKFLDVNFIPNFEMEDKRLQWLSMQYGPRLDKVSTSNTWMPW